MIQPDTDGSEPAAPPEAEASAEASGQLRVLLVWPDGEPNRDLIAVLEDAGIRVDIASDTAEALRLTRRFNHDVVLAPPPVPDDPLWLSPLLHTFPHLEAIAIVDPHDPAADAARRAGADELADPRTLPPSDLAYLLLRAAQRAKLKRENRRLVDENLRALRSQAVYARSLELLGCVDIELLQELILKAFSELCEAASAALWIRAPNGYLALRGHRGLLTRHALASQLDPEDGPLAARIEGRDPFLTAELPGEPGTGGGQQSPHGACLYVPFVAGAQTLGLLLLADRIGGKFTSEDLAVAHTAADFAGIALRNARRFHDLERVGLRDRESPTYNLSYFIDYAGKELYKASRYGRQFSLSTLRVDNLEQLRGRLSPGAFTETTRSLVAALARLTRDADVLSRVSESEFYLILPDTDRFGVLMLERRMFDTVQDLGKGDARPEISLGIGSATYPRDGQDFDELLQRCRQRMQETRFSLRRRLHLSELDFWQSIEVLLGPWPTRVEADAVAPHESGRPPGHPTAPSELSASFRGALPEGLFASVQREIGRELAREPRSRGLLYIGSNEADAKLPLIDIAPTDPSARICALVPHERGRIDHPAVTTIFLHRPGGPAVTAFEFILYLSEAAAYGYVWQEGHRAAFHTSDRPLVDHLISRLQREYDLQPY